MKKSILSLASVFAVLACHSGFAAANSGIELSESDILSLLNVKIEKVQLSQRKSPIKYKKPQVTAPIPAWRRPAGQTMTRSADDALFGAAKSKNLRLLKQLIAEGANVNHKNFNGETALHIASSVGNLQMVKYLISQGANVNARTTTQWMPIHHAIRFNHPRVANYLIGRKASLKHKTVDGFTALDFAKKSKNRQIQAIAKKYGH